MTYLQLVNHVLRRLRENTVSSVTDSDYSIMIGDLVNDAKRQVEDAWDWTALRSTISVNTTTDDNSYTLTGSGDRVRVLSAVNDTQNTRMDYKPKQWFTNINLSSTTTGAPTSFTYTGVDSNGDMNIEVWPTPDGVYNLDFEVVVRPTDLSNDADTVSIPYLPIVYLALALAARERGEQGGTQAAELYGLYQRVLSDAIAIEANNFHPEEILFWNN